MDTRGIEPRPVGLQPTARTSYAKYPDSTKGTSGI